MMTIHDDEHDDEHENIGINGDVKHTHEGCSKFFHLENAIFAKKIFSFAELSRTPCLSFAVHVGQDF